LTEQKKCDIIKREVVFMLYSNKSKSRGQRRRLNALCNRIDEFVPFTETARRYEHFHVPNDNFIEHPKTSSKIKTAFCRKWLETTQEFISKKPQPLIFAVW